MIPRRRYRRRMGFLSLVLQQLLLVGDNAAAHPPVAAVTTVTTTVPTTTAIPAAVSTAVPDIGQGSYAEASGGPPLPPLHDLFLDSYADRIFPHAIASDRHPRRPGRSPPEPHLAKLDVDGSRTRRRDRPPSTAKRFPPDHVFSENSDGRRDPRTAEGGAGEPLSTIKRFPPDTRSFPELSNGQRDLLVAEEAAALCSDGNSFFVTSSAVPDAEGCYVAAEGTSFGQGFVYVLRGGGGVDDRNVYPKLITTDGESEYFWAVALVEGFSGGDILVDCISKQTTYAAVHPAGATWQCDVDGTGGLIPVTDSDFSVACGCATTTASTTTVSTSSVSTTSSTPVGGGSATPSTAPAATLAPAGDDADRGLGTLSPQTAPPGGGVAGTPTSPPTPVGGCYDDDNADCLDFTPSPNSESERSTIASPAPIVLDEGTVATSSGGNPATKGPSTALTVSAGSCMLGVVLVVFSW